MANQYKTWIDDRVNELSASILRSFPETSVILENATYPRAHIASFFWCIASEDNFQTLAKLTKGFWREFESEDFKKTQATSLLCRVLSSNPNMQIAFLDMKKVVEDAIHTAATRGLTNGQRERLALEIKNAKETISMSRNKRQERFKKQGFYHCSSLLINGESVRSNAELYFKIHWDLYAIEHPESKDYLNAPPPDFIKRIRLKYISVVDSFSSPVDVKTAVDLMGCFLEPAVEIGGGFDGYELNVVEEPVPKGEHTSEETKSNPIFGIW